MSRDISIYFEWIYIAYQYFTNKPITCMILFMVFMSDQNVYLPFKKGVKGEGDNFYVFNSNPYPVGHINGNLYFKE